jgi:diguanylate cyclase (GGDEF)-like protein
VSVFASVTTIRDGTGRFIGAVAVNRDNSEIVAARSRVNLAEKMLTDVLDAAGAMSVVVDLDGLIVAANREWLDVALATGAPMAMVNVGGDYLGPVRRAVAAGDDTAASALDLLESVLQGAMSSGTTEYRCDRPDGPHWYLMDVTRLTDGRAAIVSHREVTEQHLLQVELEHSRTHDDLTDLGNREWLEQRVARCLAGRTPDCGELGLIVCDVDGFAAVNEALGYTTGDTVLRTLGTRLQALCPTGLAMVRLGGDQFAVFAESMWGAVPLVDVAERLRVGAAEPIEIDGHRLSLSLSVGIAAVLPHGGQSAAEVTSELVARADTARLDSKAQGRNRVRHYRPDLRDRTTSLLLMRHDFAEALRTDALELHYQQIRRMADETVVGFEALLRWPRAAGPLLTPGTFGPLIEEPTIAGTLAAWTIRTAVGAAGVLRGEPATHSARVAVNISARQFLDVDVAAHLEQAMTALAVPPPALVVEVTETATFTDDLRITDQLTRVQDLGVKVALDDFGTGFSSLTHLRALPVDEVKVDQSFTAGLGTDPASDALVRALIALAHDLGMKATAEGVETRAQREWLVAAGCDYYQGFLAHRPARLSEVLASAGD